MNTKPIPIIMSLAAALVSCIISISQGVDFATFLARLFLSVFLFYFVGIVVGVFLLNAFGPPRPEGDDDIFDNEIEREEDESDESESEDGDESEESSEGDEEDVGEEAFADEELITGDAGVESIPVEDSFQENIEDENIAGSVDL